MKKDQSTEKFSDQAAELDTIGLSCPEPVMLLHRRMRELPPGASLKMCASDPSVWRDVPDFCRHLGHQLLDRGRNGETMWFLLRKKDAESAV